MQTLRKGAGVFKVSNEDFVQLENGGVIAFEEYGNASGVPVIFCHGWPSSRTMAQLTDNAARDLGIRIISPDRPGISGSSLQPNRGLSDWPPVVRQLVDHLGIGGDGNPLAHRFYLVVADQNDLIVKHSAGLGID